MLNDICFFAFADPPIRCQRKGIRVFVICFALYVLWYFSLQISFLFPVYTKFVNVSHTRLYSHSLMTVTGVQKKTSAHTKSLGGTVISLNTNMKSLNATYDLMGEVIPIAPPSTIPNGEVSTRYRYVPQHVKIIKLNREICMNSPNLEWIFYVHANPRKPKFRKLIRETWARSDIFGKNRSKVVFLVGVTASPKVQDIIDSEFRDYGDLVQGNFKDSYHNLTLKAIMGLYFISKYCSHVPYAVKADDDAFVNIFKIMDLVKKVEPSRRFLMCFKWNNMTIMRTGTGNMGPCIRWCVPDHVFPGETHFPPYCAGLGYVISTVLISELYNISQSIPYFHIDDVFATGLLVRRASSFTWIDFMDNYNMSSMFRKNKIEENPNQVLFSHIHAETAWRKAWDKLVSAQYFPKSMIPNHET